MTDQWTDKKLEDEFIFDEIRMENHRQLNKWGVQSHSVFEWLTYTAEELAELAKAISEYTYRDGRLVDIKKEAIQTATLALKIAEMAKHKLGKELGAMGGNKM